MAQEFTDITIVGVNEVHTLPREDGTKLWNVRLDLSATAPQEWCALVEEIYEREPWYMMRQSITVYADRITINGADISSDHEMDQHRAALKEVVARANDAYRRMLERQERAAEVARKREATERDVARKLAERWSS